jgi:acyl-CoA dehydrogenase
MQDSDEDTGRMLADAAGRLFEQHLSAATLRAAEQGTWPETLWNAVVDAGLTQALLPEAAGGFGIAPADALKLLRVAAEHAAPVPLAETMLAHWLLARAGIAPPDGPLTFTCADVLRRADGGWRLSGTAARVPWARRARAIAVLAVVDGIPHLALVEPNGWHAEPGENLAREPRDDAGF